MKLEKQPIKLSRHVEYDASVVYVKEAFLFRNTFMGMISVHRIFSHKLRESEPAVRIIVATCRKSSSKYKDKP
jgi:hypothetical protein